MANEPAQRNRYKDIDLFFEPNPITKDVPKKVDVNAVLRSCRHLVLLAYGEKPFHPEIGAGLREYLFEPFSLITRNEIESDIRTVIQTYEPRARVNSISVNESPEENGIAIRVEIFVLDIIVPVSFEVLLNRVR
jgi:phage baseplate assembly protein W